MSVLPIKEEETGKPSASLSSASFVMGWSDVPDTLNCLDKGSAYSLSLRPAFSHVGLISSLLNANLNNGMRCAVITPMAPETFLQRCGIEEQRNLRSAIADKKLLLFSLLADTRKNVFRFGVERLLKELSQNGADNNHFVVVDQAEQLFSLHHQESALGQLESYKKWLEQTQCSALFLFSELLEDRALSWVHYALVEKMNGSAHLNYEHGEAELWVDFWQANGVTTAEHHILLQDTHWGGKRTQARITPLPRLHLTPLPPGPFVKDELEAEDANDIYHFGDFAIPCATRKSWNWKAVNSLVGLVHAIQNAHAATVLIAVAKDTDWLQLAQAVHSIRSHAGPRLRIMIVDRERSIRYQHEALLLRFGANLVLRASDALSRLPLFLESLQGQFYLQGSTISFDEAVASATPPPIKGYLPPALFCNEVWQALIQAKVLCLPCSMVVLPYPLPQDLSTSLKQFGVSREGDLLTISSRHCYLFLYGCLTSDYAALLDRLIGLNNTPALEEMIFFNDEDAILDTLKSLAQADTFSSFSQESPITKGSSDFTTDNNSPKMVALVK